MEKQAAVSNRGRPQQDFLHQENDENEEGSDFYTKGAKEGRRPRRHTIDRPSNRPVPLVIQALLRPGTGALRGREFTSPLIKTPYR